MSKVPKKLLISLCSMVAIVFLALGTALNPAFWSQEIMPGSIRGKFAVNADIIPAAKEENAIFVSVNPNFRAAFGDKNNPTAAYLRFSAVPGSQARLNNQIGLNPFKNTSEVINALGDSQVAGVELTLISASLNESDLGKSETSFSKDDEELVKLARELLGETVSATPSAKLDEVKKRVEQIETQTTATKELGVDVVKNLAVAPDVDLNYYVDAGRGITSKIILGDREHFDVACLSALSQGVSELCDLPRNHFSFLLTLDAGLHLEKSLVSIDSGTYGSYFIADSNNNFIMRLKNPQAIDKDGNVLSDLSFTITPATQDGSELPGFYIMNIDADLHWLTMSNRVYPVGIETGFYLDHGDLVQTTTIAK